MVTLTMKGYVKRVPLETYGVQHRGGKGKMGMAHLKDLMTLFKIFLSQKIMMTLTFFTNFGRIYSLQVFEIPEASRIAKGTCNCKLARFPSRANKWLNYFAHVIWKASIW